MKRILVTGATGFIGRNLLPVVAAGPHEVHALYHVKSDPLGGVEWHQANLLDPIQTSNILRQIKPTHLLHLAWYAEHGKFWSSPENPKWLSASRHLLREFCNHGGQRFVGAGTFAEYDWSTPATLSEETSPLLPSTIYGTSKLAFATDLQNFAKDTGLSSAWGRMFLTFGPYEAPQRLVPAVICSLLKGEPALCTSGEQIRDVLYVEDAARAFLTLLESDVTGAVNIASGEAWPLKGVIYKIADKLGRNDLVKLGALKGNEPPRLAAASNRLFHEMNWRPKYSVDIGLDKTIEWWKRNYRRI